MILTTAELLALTGKQRASAQRRSLDALGVRYGMRADGTLVVLQSAVEAAIGENPIEDLEPQHVYQYIETRKANAGVLSRHPIRAA